MPTKIDILIGIVHGSKKWKWLVGAALSKDKDIQAQNYDYYFSFSEYFI